MGLDAFSHACEKVAAQMVLQLEGLDLELVRALPRYKYVIRDLRAGDQAGEVKARCLPDTWSLYEQRFFHAAREVDMLIVQSHNAVAPVPVLCLEDGRYYKAGTIPPIARETITRRNEREQRLIVSMLALGLEAGERALSGLSDRSQRRYRAMLQDCLKKRRGRVRSL